MDRAVKPPRPRYKFSVLGSDWVEWLIVGLLCVVAALGIALLTGSLGDALAAGVVLLAAATEVIALL